MQTIRIFLIALSVLGPVASIAWGSDPFGDGPKFPINRSSSTRGETITNMPVERDQLRVKSVKVGRVGQAGQITREELIRIFGLWREQHVLLADGSIKQHEAYATGRLVQIRARVQQNAGGDFYLVAGESMIDGEVLMVEAPAGVVWADRTWIDLYAVGVGVRDWVTVMGAGRRSPLYRPIQPEAKEPGHNAPDRDAFVSALKQGTVFNLVALELSICPACSGRKEYRGRAEKKQNPDKTYPCQDCAETGQKRELVNYRIEW